GRRSKHCSADTLDEPRRSGDFGLARRLNDATVVCRAYDSDAELWASASPRSAAHDRSRRKPKPVGTTPVLQGEAMNGGRCTVRMSMERSSALARRVR